MKNLTSFFLIIILTNVSCKSQNKNSYSHSKINKTETEWKNVLTENEFNIIRNKGTEPAFSGEYWNSKANGTYCCKACGLPLFDSKTKFKSGTGWPSFYNSIEENVTKVEDNSQGWNRTSLVKKHMN